MLLVQIKSIELLKHGVTYCEPLTGDAKYLSQRLVLTTIAHQKSAYKALSRVINLPCEQHEIKSQLLVE